jgi:hypothetical protein
LFLLDLIMKNLTDEEIYFITEIERNLGDVRILRNNNPLKYLVKLKRFQFKEDIFLISILLEQAEGFLRLLENFSQNKKLLKEINNLIVEETIITKKKLNV